ncbi:Holliday junction resolvase RecU [Lachnospiraceae bacterium ZAX-1]
MATWNSRGLRGSTLEELINRTNEKYKAHDLALIQKVPTPITPVEIDKDSHHITRAYFEQKSTVDYIGAVQGIPVCFDAKECSTDTFPLQNIHVHQVEFLEKFETQGGISFLILFFSHKNEFYYLRQKKLMEFWKRAQEGGRKSFRYEELESDYFIESKQGILVPYLDAIQKDLMQRG